MRHIAATLKRIGNLVRIVSHCLVLYHRSRPRSRERGYNVFGYFSRMNGQGEAARAFADSLCRAQEKFCLIDFFDTLHQRIPRAEEERYRKHYGKTLRYRTNVFFVALDLLKLIKPRIGFLFKNRHNIVTFWWEFESGFEDRIPLLNEFDEVYVFSDFTKNILTSLACRKFAVTKIAYPFAENWTIQEEPAAVRQRYHLTGNYCFFFNFDFLSGYNRKNPEAIIAALGEEFPAEEQVVLVLKTNNTDKAAEKTNRFLQQVERMGLTGRVIIIEEPLARDQFMTLLNAMDCYISLHRGEGLGLGILEALALRKPVIATNYGGNTEYMQNPLARAVPYTLVPADDDYEPYRRVKHWAEPDRETARRYMRQVYRTAAGGKDRG